MRSYYNPATKLRKGEKPLTVLEKLQKIDLSGLNAAAERIAGSLSSIGESLSQIKIPETTWNETHINLGSFDTKEEAGTAAIEKVKELAEGNQLFGGFENDQED